MITWLIGMLAPRVGEKAARPAAFGLLAVAIGLALLGSKCAYDRSVIEKHEAKREAATAKADRKADANAAEQRRADDNRLTAETTEIKEAVNEAERNGADPRAVYYDCLRRVQAARRSGVSPAEC